MFYIKAILNYFFNSTTSTNPTNLSQNIISEPIQLVESTDLINTELLVEENDNNNNNNGTKWSITRVLNDQMLSDNEIYQSLLILKEQFKHINGFWDPQSFNARFFKNQSNKLKLNFQHDSFVQILHDGQLHWYTITNINSKRELKIYDSFYMKKTYENNFVFKQNLRRLFATNNNNHHQEEIKPIECIIESVQTQSNQTMCGLFSIAFAYDLCVGLNPSDQTYDESKMRKHLFKCLTEKRFTQFPLKRNASISIIPSTEKIFISI